MRTRFTMDMNEDLAAKLERIRGAIGAANKADVIREALVLLLTLVESAEEGQALFIGPTKDEAQRVLVPSLDSAARAARNRRTSRSETSTTPQEATPE